MRQRPPHPVIQVEALLWELEERGVDADVIARYVQRSIHRAQVAETRQAAGAERLREFCAAAE